MVTLEGVTISGFVTGVAFAIPEGAVCKIVTETDQGKDLLLDVLSGLKQPDRGSVSLLGVDIYDIPVAEAISVFRDVGVIWRGGGLISNLRVWENIALPSEYHHGVRPTDLEEQVRDRIGCLGTAAGGLGMGMVSLPAHLQEHERTAAGLVRSMLMEPHLLIYDSIFEGLSFHAKRELASCVVSFHRERPGRTSIFVTSNERSLDEVEAEMIIHQTGLSFQQGAH
jgi:phospholipid/cholesterol/gamma-HCH transport system ATP-binding protein